jgi:hypothetical protein
MAISSAKSSRRPRVFIIHGRDLEARNRLAKCVRALGLDVLTFEEVANALGPNPFIGDVVFEGIKQADLIIALFTPDEQTALYAPETGDYQGESQHESRWQARPNVIFEAGVALGIRAKDTILVSLGADVSLFSDVAGRHILDLTKEDAIEDLMRRIQRVLPNMPPPKGSWRRRAGDFQGCLRPRWPHYDELHDLESNLRGIRIKKKASLWDVVSKVAVARQNWKIRDSDELMEAISKHLNNDDRTDDAYWWLIVLGVLRFQHTGPWWTDEETWDDSVEYAELSERGLKLLKKLQLLPNR